MNPLWLPKLMREAEKLIEERYSRIRDPFRREEHVYRRTMKFHDAVDDAFSNDYAALGGITYYAKPLTAEDYKVLRELLLEDLSS